MKKTSYDEYFCPELKEIFNDIRSGILGDPSCFDDLLNSITNNNDHYLVGADFLAYKNTQQEVDKMYRDKQAWAQKSIHGAIHMAKFSSDRTINEYATKIWNIKSIQIQNTVISKNSNSK